MLVQPLDPLFWPDRPEGEALHVHKLARKRSARIEGGLARPMLDWALKETRKAGLPYLRLDCAPDETLCAIYAACGFTRLDLVEPKPDFWSWRWEKKAQA